VFVREVVKSPRMMTVQYDSLLWLVCVRGFFVFEPEGKWVGRRMWFFFVPSLLHRDGFFSHFLCFNFRSFDDGNAQESARVLRLCG
jgi:hypothetical protein